MNDRKSNLREREVREERRLQIQTSCSNLLHAKIQLEGRLGFEINNTRSLR
ncbi:hypothetical protein KBB69_01650 [Candidatus Dojkabacteria bacterium]|jgi:hypothetical protein|nr:hypothetical protein [Candidatus Dojkabacteria bacterium]